MQLNKLILGKDVTHSGIHVGGIGTVYHAYYIVDGHYTPEQSGLPELSSLMILE